MKQEILKQLSRLCEKAQVKNKEAPTGIYVYSEKLDVEFIFPNNSQSELFHIASVSKYLSTVVFLRLEEKGLWSLHDKLYDYLPKAALEGLFSSPIEEISLEDCLKHRSGVADYFEGKNRKGIPFIQQVLNHPDESYDYEQLLNYVRVNMKPVGKRLEKFNYGDTGFLLVMMAAEIMMKKEFQFILQEEIFDVCQMRETQALTHRYTESKRLKPEKILLQGVNTVNYKSLSCDQADGGIVSTAADLVKFQKALIAGKLITFQSIERMRLIQGKFRSGIHYGMGLMEIRFEEFFPLMRKYPRPFGHIGVLATHLYYFEVWDLHLVLNFGNTDSMSRSFIFLSQLTGLLKKLIEKSQ